MITRAQRRRYISSHLLKLALALLLISLAIIFIFYGNYRSQMQQVQAQIINPDDAIGIAIDEKSLDIATQGRLEDSLARPLLMSTRRPYEPLKVKPKPVVKAAAPPKVAPTITELLASIIITSNRKVAFLSGADGTTRLEEGMTFKEWQVTTITPNTLILTYDDQKKVLQLRTFATANPIAPMRQLGQQKEKK